MYQLHYPEEKYHRSRTISITEGQKGGGGGSGYCGATNLIFADDKVCTIVHRECKEKYDINNGLNLHICGLRIYLFVCVCVCVCACS
jgi:hypothetical protein